MTSLHAIEVAGKASVQGSAEREALRRLYAQRKAAPRAKRTQQEWRAHEAAADILHLGVTAYS